MSWPASQRQLGTWVKIPAPEVIEALAAGGLDFVAIDCEHGAVDRRTMSALVGLAKAVGLSVLVRVAGHRPEQLQPPLDAGADGLLVPHVDEAAQARTVVDAGRFPPLGRRGGSTSTRAGGWGVRDAAELIRHGNDDVALVAQIETPSAVADVGQILAVDGLDGVMIGPFDLSLASGLPPQDPAFAPLVRHVEEAARGRHVLGGVAPSAAAADSLLAQGYTFVIVGADTSMLRTAAESMMAVRP